MFFYDASNLIDKEKYKIINFLIEGIRNKREKRQKGETLVPSSRYRLSWCSFLREFWADACIAKIIGKGDHKSIRINGFPSPKNGLKWIIKSISEYIFHEYFSGHSYMMFYDCPHKEFDADKFSDDFNLERASLPIFITDMNDISKTILTNLCCSDRNTKKYQVNLTVKKKATTTRYSIYVFIINFIIYNYNYNYNIIV